MNQIDHHNDRLVDQDEPNQRRQDDSIRRPHKSIIYTIALYYSFIAVGLCCSIFNPTLLQLSRIFSSNLQAVSLIFPLRALGCTVGTLTNGLLNTYFNRQILLFSFLLLKALTTFLVPHWRSLRQFYINAFFQGFFTAANVVMVNVWLNEMWSSSDRHSRHNSKLDMANVLMQALHFFFGCGTILGPLVAEPFLKEPFQDLNDRFVSNNLVWPYSIAAALTMLSCFSFFLLYLLMPYEQPTNNIKIASPANNRTESSVNLLTDDRNEIQNEQHNTRSKMFNYAVIVACALFLAMFACSEGTYLQFSAAFCSQTELNMSQAQAALMSSSLAISFTAFRGLSVFIAMRLSPATMITIDLTIILVANTIVFFSANTNPWLLALGFILLGAGFSSVFPSLFPLLEQKGYPVTDWIGSLITFSSGAAQVLAPFLIGMLIDSEPFVLVYFTFASLLGSFVFYAIMHLLIKADNRPDVVHGDQIEQNNSNQIN